jgi:hypothetical protein
MYLLSALICGVWSKASFWPYPKLLKEGSFTKQDPCEVAFYPSSAAEHVKELIEHYRSKMFKCSKPGAGYRVEIRLKNDSLVPPLEGHRGLFG